MRTLTLKNHRDKKITLDEIYERLELVLNLKSYYNSLTWKEKLSPEGDKLGAKVNRAVKQYNLCKGSFLGGNN